METGRIELIIFHRGEMKRGMTDLAESESKTFESNTLEFEN